MNRRALQMMLQAKANDLASKTGRGVVIVAADETREAGQSETTTTAAASRLSTYATISVVRHLLVATRNIEAQHACDCAACTARLDMLEQLLDLLGEPAATGEAAAAGALH
jgi:hypothetical protein